MAIAREAEPVGSLSEVREAGLDREDLLGIYRNMLLTRSVEELEQTWLTHLKNSKGMTIMQLAQLKTRPQQPQADPARR